MTSARVSAARGTRKRNLRGSDMCTLLLRLTAPLQAWGAESKFSRRTTGRAPTKSGVLGLAAAALGYGRDASLAELSNLKFAARIDQPGTIIKDFHTAHTFGEKNKQAFISERYYLSDAVFLVGLEGPRALLQRIEAALQCPVFPIFLGRRSCPPTLPLVLGVFEKPLLDALSEAPWQAAAWYKRRQDKSVWLEIVRDAAFDEPGAFVTRDLPRSFSQAHRQHAFRSAISDLRAAEIKNEISAAHGRDKDSDESVENPDLDQTQTEHDPFSELEAYDVSVED
jgi:CRISPR system Cascade subunit CasD